MVALPVPTMHGRPNSRDTIAACAVRPPLSVTIAATRRITGSQSGSVISATSTSPACTVASALDVAHHAHAPDADPLANRLPTDQRRSGRPRRVDRSRRPRSATSPNGPSPGAPAR